ncbi:MAG TPA: hypothetical protein VHA13_04315, partial [Gammaproteobacteria bacterium]|nr:hypothetical protein [Gammaproteobacteria bacterium]
PVTYQFEQLDISPQSWPLSSILEKEDRIYAFGLTTSQQDAESHLLLMGTTYPAGQGAALAVAYNFYPLHSVGEGHDTTKVDQWIDNQKAVKITGHSKGATMAMITAARHSDKITQADCLNPTALSSSTLERLKLIWNKRTKTPQINVYAQAGDCVFQLERGFLEGTNLYRVIPNTDKSSMNCGAPVPLPNFIRKGYEAHIHHFLGRSNALVLRMSVATENKSKWREFRNDIKYLLNWLRFPLEFLETTVTILARKAKRFYARHPKMIKAAIIVASLITLGALAYSGLLLPAVVLFAKPALAQLGLSLSYGAAWGITAALSVTVSFLMPYILQLANKIITAAAKFTNTALGIGVHLTAITLGSLSAIKIGLKSLCNNKSSTALIMENSAVSSRVMPARQNEVENAIKSARRQSIGGAFFNPVQGVTEPKKIGKVLVRRNSLS